jgi:hypothetical protein
MAITTKFVTSFSELYLRENAFTDSDGLFLGLNDASVASTSLAPTAANIREWFNDDGNEGTAKVCTHAFTSSSAGVADTIIYTITDAGGLVLDTLSVVYETADVADATAAATESAISNGDVNLSDSTWITSVTSAAAVITVTFTAAAGNAVLSASGLPAGTNLTFSAETITTPFADGDNSTLIVPLLMEIGTLSNEATVIDTPTFGDTFRGKLRGQLDGGQLDCQMYWAPRNTVHLRMREMAENGTALSVGIRWKPTADAVAASQELVVFNSYISSFGIDTTFDDVAKVTATLIVDGAEHFASGA